MFNLHLAPSPDALFAVSDQPQQGPHCSFYSPLTPTSSESKRDSHSPHSLQRKKKKSWLAVAWLWLWAYEAALQWHLEPTWEGGRRGSDLGQLGGPRHCLTLDLFSQACGWLSVSEPHNTSLSPLCPHLSPVKEEWVLEGRVEKQRPKKNG